MFAEIRWSRKDLFAPLGMAEYVRLGSLMLKVTTGFGARLKHVSDASVRP